MNKSELVPLIKLLKDRSVTVETHGSNDTTKAPPLTFEGKLKLGIRYRDSIIDHLEIERTGDRFKRDAEGLIIRDSAFKKIVEKDVIIRQSIPFSIIKSITPLRAKK